MNPQEMYIELALYLREVSSETDRNFLIEETAIYLNRAQLLKVKQWYDKQRNDFNEIDDSQRNIDNLRTLYITHKELENTGDDKDLNRKSFKLPEDYLFLVKDYSLTNYCNGVPVPNRLTRGENLISQLRVSFSKTDPESPISSLSDVDKLYVYYNNKFNINKVWIDYIKYPRDIKLVTTIPDSIEGYDPINSVSCELPEHTHQEIVTLAKELMHKDLNNPQEYQIENRDNYRIGE